MQAKFHAALDRRIEIGRLARGEVDPAYCAWGILYYELFHMLATADILANVNSFVERNAVMKRALIESCLTHVRNVDEFLYEVGCSNKFKGAVPSSWARRNFGLFEVQFSGKPFMQKLGCKVVEPRKVRKYLISRISQDLSHFSSTRLERTNEEKKWPWRKVTSAYCAIVQCLINLLPNPGNPRKLNWEKIDLVSELCALRR